METDDKLEYLRGKLSDVNQRIAELAGSLKKQGLVDADKVANAWNLLHDLRDDYVRQIKSAKLP